MPLSAQEHCCVELACGYLRKVAGGLWAIEPGPTLDDLYPSVLSPEVLVSNGTMKAAVEVKRLTGDSVLNEYRESILSLRRFLVPSCGGHYTINPPVDFRLPINRPVKVLLKTEVERVAQYMAVGSTAALRIPRKARLQVHN